MDKFVGVFFFFKEEALLNWSEYEVEKDYFLALNFYFLFYQYIIF